MSKESYNALTQLREYLWKNIPSDQRIAAEMNKLWQLNSKIEAYNWARDLGVRVIPQNVFDSGLDALNAGGQSFALKPVRGTSSHGVFLLSRTEHGFFCGFRRRDVSHREVVEEMLPGKYLLMPLLRNHDGSEPPLDMTIWAFKTGCPIMLVRSTPPSSPRNEHVRRWFNRDGGFESNCEATPNLIEISDKAPPPPGWKEAFETAERIMEQLPVSFVRIDFLSTDSGVYFCEFTPNPRGGNLRFASKWDEIIGEHWTRSLAILGINYSPSLSYRLYRANLWREWVLRGIRRRL